MTTPSLKPPHTQCLNLGTDSAPPPLNYYLTYFICCVSYIIYLLTSLSSALAISLLKNGVSARLVEARVIDEGQVVVNAITAGAEMASVNAVDNFIVFIYLF